MQSLSRKHFTKFSSKPVHDVDIALDKHALALCRGNHGYAERGEKSRIISSIINIDGSSNQLPTLGHHCVAHSLSHRELHEHMS